MRIAIANLLASLNRRKTASDVQEELQFHLEMLELKYIHSGMSAAEAKAAALKRFGNVENINKQCVDISSRNTVVRRVLKTCLIVIALSGLCIRLISQDLKIAHIGDTLIMIAISGRLFLYVRTLDPRAFLSGTKAPSLSLIASAPEVRSQRREG